MTLTIIEVGIGLAIVYYVLGLIVSFIVSQITSVFEIKGKSIYAVLQNSLGDTLYSNVLKKNFIKALEPYTQSPLTMLTRKISGASTNYIHELSSNYGGYTLQPTCRPSKHRRMK